MKQMTMLFLLVLALGTQVLHAAESGGATLSFWERLRSKIESMAPQKKVAATNATGGVRGAAVSSDDIYWKGEASAQSIAADELDAFMAAMAMAEKNAAGPARNAFSSFIKQYPASSLRKDAEQALALLKP